MPFTLLTRTHGRPTTDHLIATPAPASGRPWLTRLFSGEVELPTVAPAALRLADRTLAEADATARALACPDLFILDAVDCTARERLMADVIRLAAERGERVLTLSPDAAAADRLVESFASERTLRVVRAMADDENPHRPSPAVTRLTSRAMGTGRAEQLKREASLAVSTLEAKLSRFERCRAYRVRLDEIERERKEITAHLESLESTSNSPDDNPALASLNSECAVLAAKRSATESSLAAARRQRAEGMKKPGLIARLFGATRPAINLVELERNIGILEGEAKELANREASLQAEADALTRQFAEETKKQIAENFATRHAALTAQLYEREAETARLDLAIREFLPPRATLEDTVENGDPSPGSRAELERELAVARTRFAEMSHAGSDLARRLLSESNIVVGTPGCCEVDPVFRALASASHSFGLLVLDHAEELTEADFARLSSLANRWILAGDASMPEEPRAHLNGNGHHARHRTSEPTLLARLARHLDAEPWAFEGDRLVFRLVHLPADQRKALSREPVLDHPHVELRVAADGGDPVLAEIAFPAATSVVEAKIFLFSQLGEVLLRPSGERHWNRTDDCLTACWPMIDAETGEWVDLEPGVRELVSGSGAFTAAIAFDLATGWDEEKAEEWLEAHVPAASPSRLAVLPRPIAPPVHRPVPVS